MDEPKEQGKENLWSFNLLSISISIREAAMFCLTCIGQVFATLSLIYWPACLIIVCMYLINTRGFRKKKTNLRFKVFLSFISFLQTCQIWLLLAAQPSDTTHNFGAGKLWARTQNTKHGQIKSNIGRTTYKSDVRRSSISNS